MSTTPVLIVLSLLALAAAFAGGVPLKGRSEVELSAGAVARHDRPLVVRLAVLGGIVVVGQLLGAWSEAWAWVALAAAAGAGLPLALDRWQRTNGDDRPFALLMRSTELDEKLPATLDEELRDQLAELLLEEIVRIPDSLLRTIAEVDGEPQRRETICRLLAGQALRTGRDDKPEWLPVDDELTSRRNALLALAHAHPDVRAQVLSTVS